MRRAGFAEIACHRIHRAFSGGQPIGAATPIPKVVIGLLLLTGRMNMIAIWAQKNGYYFDLPLGGAAVPSYLIAILGGMISFLSPCVLPLVPAYIGYLSGQAASVAMKEARR